MFKAYDPFQENLCLTQPIKFTQALLNAQSFIHWQRLNTEPCAPLPAKQVGGRTPFDQVCGQHGVNFVLQVFRRVRCRTSCARREIWRRNASVCSSGIHTSGRKPLA